MSHPPSRLPARPIRIAVAAALVALMLGACAFGRERLGTRDREAPRRGGTLNVAITEPDTIDPSRTSHRSGLLILKQICDSLVFYDPFTGELGPGIAESWSASEDLKKFTFKIRQGVKFHNGRDVTAHDFVYSLSRFASKAAGSAEFFLLDLVGGYPELRGEIAPAFSGVRATDDMTLEVDLIEPFAELPAVLSHPAAGSAVPKEEVDKGEPFSLAPVCTGPYMVEAPWEKGKQVTLKRFEGYVPPRGVDSAGYAERIVFNMVPDSEAAYTALGKGEADVASVPIAKIVQARSVRGRVESKPNGIMAYIGFPVTKPPFDNSNVRHALQHAVDRRAIIDALLAGTRRIPDGYIPPSAGPASKGADCERVGERADDKKAKAALQAAGVDPAGFKPPVYFNDSGGNRRWLEEVVKQWDTGLSVKAELRPGEWNAYLASLSDAGVDGPFRLAAVVRYPSPESLMKPLFQGGSLDNFTRFANADFDALLRKARATADDKARASSYREAAAFLCEQMPIVPMWLDVNNYAFSNAVRWSGESRLDLFGDPVLRRIGVSR